MTPVAEVLIADPQGRGRQYLATVVHELLPGALLPTPPTKVRQTEPHVDNFTTSTAAACPRGRKAKRDQWPKALGLLHRVRPVAEKRTRFQRIPFIYACPSALWAVTVVQAGQKPRIGFVLSPWTEGQARSMAEGPRPPGRHSNSTSLISVYLFQIRDSSQFFSFIFGFPRGDERGGRPVRGRVPTRLFGGRDVRIDSGADKPGPCPVRRRHPRHRVSVGRR